MKFILIILVTTLINFFNAQIVSLETAAQCIETQNCPNYNYAKDINNSLQKYVGTWNGNLNGKTYEFIFSKGLYNDLGEKRDRLIARARIKNSSQQSTIFDQFNETDDNKVDIIGLNFNGDLSVYRMYFSGTTPEGCINS